METLNPSEPANTPRRRDFLRHLLWAGAAGCVARPSILSGAPAAVSSPSARTLPPGSDLFLEELERASYRFFEESAHPGTGQVLDRRKADGTDDPRGIASIAATGFGLTALCIAHQRGWVGREEARDQVSRTLRHLVREMRHVRGFFYHFHDWATGERAWKCELSSIDTTILMCGALCCRAHFRGGDGGEIRRLATELYERVEWPWMLNGGESFSMGWFPEGAPGTSADVDKAEVEGGRFLESEVFQNLDAHRGHERPSRKPSPGAAPRRHPLPSDGRGAGGEGRFLDSRWDHYCELMMLHLLALGSPTHPVDAGIWRAWRRPVREYHGHRFVWSPAPLFAHQFSHAWFDFRGRRDVVEGVDWFENSVEATLAHRAWCLERSAKFPRWSEDLWGVTSSDSEKGYTGWGGPPDSGPLDGTIVPCAAAGSLPFAPAECLRTLRHQRERFGDRIWTRYGFVDAFNPHTGWVNPDVIGIDVGITILMAENARTGFVWRAMARDRDLRRGMNRAFRR